MKLLRKAHEHLEEISENRDTLEWIEARLGSLNVSAEIIGDFPQNGQSRLGWSAWPEDESKVLVYLGYSWLPGSGPRQTLADALESIQTALKSCFGIAQDKAGPHIGRIPKLLVRLKDGEVVADLPEGVKP